MLKNKVILERRKLLTEITRSCLNQYKIIKLVLLQIFKSKKWLREESIYSSNDVNLMLPCNKGQVTFHGLWLSDIGINPLIAVIKVTYLLLAIALSFYMEFLLKKLGSCPILRSNNQYNIIFCARLLISII